MDYEWPAAGTVLASRYRLVALLETGGMAQIWRADDDLLGRPVAVKLPTGPHLATPQVAWREARMAARLSHPAIAQVHDYGEAVRPDGALASFVVMELVAGDTVAARLDDGPFPWPEAARVGAGVAEALAAAHANGVVHRDIKPGNVMLTPNGVKILDFGISAAAGEPDNDDTGATFGTPAYVAPERLDGRPAEPATDVYGLGILLFEMVTGQPPYPVDTWEELAAARVTGPGRLPRTLPAAFRDVVTRCLNEDPHHRPAAGALQDELDALAMTGAAGHHGIGPGGARGSGQPEYVAGRAMAATLRMDVPVPERRRAAFAGVAVVVVAAGLLLALYVRPAHHGQRAEPLPPATAVTDAPPATGAPSPAATSTGAPATTRDSSVAPVPSSAPSTGSPQSMRPSASGEPSVTPSGAPDFSDAVAQVRAAVRAGADDGQIRPDVATDLLNLLAPLNAGDSSAVAGVVDQVRQKVASRVGEGSVSPGRATIIDSGLDNVTRAAATTTRT